MGVRKQRDIMFFSCDIPGCRTQHHERCAGNWDESRMAFVGAKEIGWRLTKERGRWIAECPDCAGAVSYRSADDLADILKWG